MIGSRLFDLRTEEGLTQLQLAKILQVNKRSISMYELGNSQPSHETLCAIAKLFHVSADYLLGLSNESAPSASDERYFRLPPGITPVEMDMLQKLASFLVTQQEV